MKLHADAAVYIEYRDAYIVHDVISTDLNYMESLVDQWLLTVNP